MNDHGLDRRTLLKLGAFAAAGSAGLVHARPALAARTPGEVPRPARRAKNLIFMVSDGMSFGTLALAELFNREHRAGSTRWTRLWSAPGVRRSIVTTFSANAYVTDSAAAGSAWGIGVHCNNGAVNVTPDGRRPTPLCAHAAQNGKRTGLVTTTRVTHATPASFIANVPRRDMEDAIAEQMLERRVDVVLGGGARHFKDPLLAAATDCTVVRTKGELLAAGNAPAQPGARLLGLFHANHVPYALDRDETIPSLADMTRVSLRRLEDAPDGFVLQVEGGRVDHAAHNNDAGSLIADQLDFDDAVGAVVDWCAGRDDTLVVVTTDHGNANPGLTYYAQPGKDRFARLPSIVKSFDWIDAEVARSAGSGKDLDRAVAADVIPAVVARATGYELPPAETEMLRRVVRGERVMPMLAANGWWSVLGQILAEHFGVAFLSPNHTSDHAELTVFGPGSELFAPALDNIDVHALAVSSLGLAAAQPLPGNEGVLTPARPLSDD
jgi:alkaline phosphatase